MKDEVLSAGNSQGFAGIGNALPDLGAVVVTASDINQRAGSMITGDRMSGIGIENLRRQIDAFLELLLLIGGLSLPDDDFNGRGRAVA